MKGKKRKRTVIRSRSLRRHHVKKGKGGRESRKGRKEEKGRSTSPLQQLVPLVAMTKTEGRKKNWEEERGAGRRFHPRALLEGRSNWMGSEPPPLHHRSAPYEEGEKSMEEEESLRPDLPVQ